MPSTSTLITTVLITCALTACAGDPVPLAKIVKDKSAYSNQYFSQQSVAENVIKKMPQEDNAKVFKNLKVTFETKITNGDKINTRQEVLTYSGSANGLTQVITEYASNDITTGFTFSLSYKGLQELKWGYVSAAKGYSDMPYEIKEVSRWDKLGSKPGDAFKVDFKWGNVVQIMNFHDGQYDCTVNKLVQASELQASLTGQARLIECQILKDGATFLRSKYAYLEDLGFAVPVEIVSANFKTEYKLTHIDTP